MTTGTAGFALVLLVAFSAQTGRADDIGLTPALDQCFKNSGVSTVEMVTCFEAEIAVQDERLNAAYKKALAALTLARQNELQAVQRLWLRFRDANCKFALDPDNGTIGHLAASECVMDMTARRAQELEAVTPR